MESLLDSGKIIGSPASVKELAQQCHIPFPLSLRAFLLFPQCPLPACIHLHIKVLVPHPTIPIETMIKNMRRVYKTAGIRVVVASRETLTGFPVLHDVDIGECVRGETTFEQDVLYLNRNHVGANEVVVYFVNSTVPPANGCATHPDDKPGAVVTTSASNWTVAHEVGHVLSLEHISGESEECPDDNPGCCSTPDFTRLMTACGTGGIGGTPSIDADEIEDMNESDLVAFC